MQPLTIVALVFISFLALLLNLAALVDSVVDLRVKRRGIARFRCPAEARRVWACADAREG